LARHQHWHEKQTRENPAEPGTRCTRTDGCIGTQQHRRGTRRPPPPAHTHSPKALFAMKLMRPGNKNQRQLLEATLFFSALCKRKNTCFARRARGCQGPSLLFPSPGCARLRGLLHRVHFGRRASGSDRCRLLASKVNTTRRMEMRGEAHGAEEHEGASAQRIESKLKVRH
jgi:hypothetical protein